MPYKTTRVMIENAEELSQMRDLLAPIVGKICWRVELLYADELFVDVGEEISYRWVKDGKERTDTKGEFFIASCGTDWVLVKQGGVVVASSEPRDTILSKLSVLVGNAITGIDITYPTPGLTINLGNEYVLSIVPQDEDDEEFPYWQVFFTTSRKILEGGPGTSFSIVEDE